MPVWTEKGNFAAITMIEGSESLPLEDCLRRLASSSARHLLVHLLDEALSYRDNCSDLATIKKSAALLGKGTISVCGEESARMLLQKGIAQEGEIRHALHEAIMEVMRGPSD